MTIDIVREYCLAFPHATENVQWGSDLCFKVAGKLFAVAPLEVAPVRLSFKCSPENFAALCERPGIKPAAYLARAQWVSLERWDALGDGELRDLLAHSYQLIFENLPRKLREELAGGSSRGQTSSGRMSQRTLTRAKKPATKQSPRRLVTAKGTKLASRKTSKKAVRKASKRG